MVLGLGIGAEYNYEAIRWSPHNVPPVGSLELWLNHDDGQTVVSEQVSEWKDKSGNNRHATQGSAGNRATFDNGALDFESGEGDHYDLGSQVEIEEEDGFHIHIVCEVDSTGTNMTIFGLNNIDHMLEFRAGGDNVRIGLGGTTTEIIPDSANNFHQTAGKFLLSLVRKKGSTGSLELYKNGSVLNQSSPASNKLDAEFSTLGVRNADRYFDGKIHEVLVYNSGNQDWTDIELGFVFDYLTTKHNI